LASTRTVDDHVQHQQQQQQQQQQQHHSNTDGKSLAPPPTLTAAFQSIELENVAFDFQHVRDLTVLGINYAIDRLHFVRQQVTERMDNEEIVNAGNNLQLVKAVREGRC
jgi:hypothetical protein